MFDNNNLSLGIKQAAEAMTSYYEIGTIRPIPLWMVDSVGSKFL
jgi:hypothetical protein